MPTIPLNPRRPRRRRALPEAPRPELREVTAQGARGLTWLHVERPDVAAAEELGERFGWHELDREDVVSRRQRPKIDEYPDYLFVVLHFPVYDARSERLTTAELDAFIGPDYLVTLTSTELGPVSRLLSRVEADEAVRERFFAHGPGRLLYEVLDALFGYCFPILDNIGAKLERVEDAMFAGRAEEIVRDLSNVKQEIISYRKIIKPERATLRVLERRLERFSPAQDEELDIYFDDVVDAAERIWDLLDNYKEVVEGLEVTNESILAHRQNDVLRFLATISVIFLPLTLISSIFGMNVAFPGEGTQDAFWSIAVVLAVVFLGLLAFFRYKRWL